MWSGKLFKTPASPIPAKDLYEQLEQQGQLVAVKDEESATALPACVTHIRLPSGEVKRIRFA